jgi:hypothetical protein
VSIRKRLILPVANAQLKILNAALVVLPYLGQVHVPVLAQIVPEAAAQAARTNRKSF